MRVVGHDRRARFFMQAEDLVDRQRALHARRLSPHEPNEPGCDRRGKFDAAFAERVGERLCARVLADHNPMTLAEQHWVGAPIGLRIDEKARNVDA